MFGDLFKAVVGVVVETPIALVADAVTLGGALSDKDKPYTVEVLEKMVKNVEKSTE